MPRSIPVPISARPGSVTLFMHMGGRAFGPPLCRGCAPATPPYKTIPHRPCAFFASCRLASMAATAHQLRHQEPEWFQGRLPGQLLWLSSYPKTKKLTTKNHSSAPPQRPALPSRPVHASPSPCLANSFASPTCRLMPLTGAVPCSSPAVPCCSPQFPAVPPQFPRSPPAVPRTASTQRCLPSAHHS